MIIGLGSDLIDIRRVEQTERYGALVGIFTRSSRKIRAPGRPGSHASVLAPGGLCQARGTGLRAGVFWRDMAAPALRSSRRCGSPAAPPKTRNPPKAA
jgi:holo-[acyl-carrier protein] synthase